MVSNVVEQKLESLRRYILCTRQRSPVTAQAFKRFILSVALILTVSNEVFSAPTPPDLVGIWAAEGAEFKGELLINGSAVYLDTDGVGGLIGSESRNSTELISIGVRIVVTEYDAKSNKLSVDLTENGRTVGSITLTYDPNSSKLLLSGLPWGNRSESSVFTRYAKVMSIGIRKGLGLEPKSQ